MRISEQMKDNSNGLRTTNELERVFKALADQTRLRILNLLLRGELCVCEIHSVLASSQPTVSRHLTYLKNAGLVQDRRAGPRVYYALAQPASGVHHPLFGFLRRAFDTSSLFKQDLLKLGELPEGVACESNARRLVSRWVRAKGGASHRTLRTS